MRYFSVDYMILSESRKFLPVILENIGGIIQVNTFQNENFSVTKPIDEVARKTSSSGG